MLLSKFDRMLANRRPTDEMPIAEPEPETAAHRASEAASAIGSHYEVLHGGLDRLSMLSEHFRSLEPLLQEMREPLTAEYEARRNDYVELVGLRSSSAEALQRLGALEREANDLKQALAHSDERRAELSDRIDEQTAHAQQTRLELDRLRTDLSNADQQVRTLTTTERELISRLGQQDEDLASLRDLLNRGERERAELAGLKARVDRDFALLSDEHEAVKSRYDESASEVSRLARSESSLQAVIVNERARAASEQVEASRVIRSLETQAEAFRTENAAMRLQLATSAARADRLDTLNGELSITLSEVQTATQDAEREVARLKTESARDQERLREQQDLAEITQKRLATMEAARLAAVDRAEQLARSVAEQERALARNEERANKLQAILSALQIESEERVRDLTDHIGSMRSSLEGVRAESAITAAALDKARRERLTQNPFMSGLSSTSGGEAQKPVGVAAL